MKITQHRGGGPRYVRESIGRRGPQVCEESIGRTTDPASEDPSHANE